MNKLLILTEAGKSIGYGHYMRCSALQKEAKKQGLKTKMLLHVNGSESFEVEGEIYNWLEDKILKINILSKEFDIVLIDSYLANENIYSDLKQNFKKVVVIDDYNRIDYDADLIINPNVFFEQIDYTNQKAKCIGGKEFVLLRPIFISSKEHENRQTTDKNIDNLLITIGGTDFRNLLPKLIKVCLNQNLKKVQVICPQENERKELEKKFLRNENIEILGKQSAEEMHELYLKNNLVISACGQTLHELASLGKPTIGICLAIDQVPNQKYYLEKSFLLENINWDDINIATKISSQITNFQNLDLKRVIQNYAPTLIGKNGVNKCIEAIFSNQTLTFRTAQLQDAKIYFEWANDEAVRENAFNSEPIVWENHLAWFESKIASSSLLLLFFLESSNTPIGQVRVDWNTDTQDREEKNGWIDYSVSKNYRGKKLATKMLIHTVKLLQKQPTSISLKGIVKQENMASQKAFLRANFEHIDSQNVNNFECQVFQYKTDLK